MELTVALPWAIFGAITVGVWAFANAFTKEDSRASQRLEELRNPSTRKKKETDKGFKNVLSQAFPVMAKALGSKSEFEQNELRVRLANAGYNHENALQIYLAVKVALLAAGALLGTAYGVFVYGLTRNLYLSIALVGGVSFYLPELVLRMMASSRKQKVFRSLPDALDLLVICVEAGLGLDAGLRRIGDELLGSHPELCQDIALCNIQVQMGRARREVLRDFGIRTGVDDVKALAAILIQAERFGSSIGQALRVQSDAMRVKRRQLAEEKAQKSAVQLLFPMVLFIFPGIFVVLVGPAAIKMMAIL